jgi:long-chain acyl-CoA synthetase
MQGQIAPDTSTPATRHEVLYGERVVTCFSDRPPTLDAMLRAAVARKPDGVALVLGEKRVTYAELDRVAENVARNLIASGFKRGERIAMLLGNCLEFIFCALGAVRAGMIVVPLNTRQRAPEIDYVLQQCGASALVYDADCEANLPAPRADLRNQWVVGSGRAPSFAELTKDAPAAALPELHQEDTAFLLYTSGTTGNPKGAMLTHASIIHSLLNFQHGYGLHDGDVTMLAVPASHVTGLVALILATINVAGTTVILPTFKAPEFLAVAARERMTYTLMVPRCIISACCSRISRRHDLSAHGASPASAARRCRKRPSRASRRCCRSSISAMPMVRPKPPHPRRCFRPARPSARSIRSDGPVTGAHIVVADDDGHEVPAGQDGELLIAGAMVVPGYWDNPDATRTGFVGGYWRSGDIGRMDADGYVYVVDRKKDMINRAGFKIYCTEVENVMSHHPAIVESAVVGKPDPVLGERVHAFVYSPDGGNEADIRKYCAERLSDYKVPDTITFLKEPLPRNANGKILKTELRKMMAS